MFAKLPLIQQVLDELELDGSFQNQAADSVTAARKSNQAEIPWMNVTSENIEQQVRQALQQFVACKGRQRLHDSFLCASANLTHLDCCCCVLCVKLVLLVDFCFGVLLAALVSQACLAAFGCRFSLVSLHEFFQFFHPLFPNS